MEELSRIFAGDLVDWSELGWEQQRINVYTHSEGSGANTTFASLVMEPFRQTLTPGAIAYSSDAEIAEAIALDRAGIGFISFAQEHTAKPVGIKDGCGMTHKPTPFAVKAGEYPLSRELYFYTTQITRADIADFVGFSVSESGYDAVRDAGYINRGITISAFDDFIERIVVSLLAPQEDFDLDLMRQLARDLGEGTRLSATIRFEQSGDVQITGESSQQLSAAIDYIARQDLSNRQVVLVGFSDSDGLFAANRAVALKRANAVRDALLEPGRSELTPDDVVALAYGELMPAACNDTSDGRSKNRRVEVWLVPRRGGPITLNRQP
jgi:phosphate transport system substrate-binding protein